MGGFRYSVKALGQRVLTVEGSRGSGEDVEKAKQEGWDIYEYVAFNVFQKCQCSQVVSQPYRVGLP